MAPPQPSKFDSVLVEAQFIHDEAKAALRRARIHLQLTTQHLEHLQTKEVTRHDSNTQVR